MRIPKKIMSVLEALEQQGYEAYIVGGCVRDHLMGVTPHDYDITTSATPPEIERVFSGWRVIETGLKHGTVTVISEGEPVEITTFRIDGEYLDGRHPEAVEFTRNLADDVSRRDFTMNGIAYNPKSGFHDFHGGIEDIKNGVIRCIGDADNRFNEDALRILRALRFSSVLGFGIEEETAASLKRNCRLLEKVSAERIFTELKRLLCGKDVFRVMMDFPEVFVQLIPQLKQQIGYNQNSRFHDSNLYEHTARSVAAAENEPAMRLAMLLHDIGKPLCRSEDESGEAHYYGHGGVSADIADEILRGFKSDNATRVRVCEIVKYHDMPITLSRRFIRRQLSSHGPELFRDIVYAHIADDEAKKAEYADRIPQYNEALAMAEEINSQAPCLTIKALAVNGSDLRDIVPPSPEMGEILKTLLNEVIDGTLPNEREVLLRRARELKKQ